MESWIWRRGRVPIWLSVRVLFSSVYWVMRAIKKAFVEFGYGATEVDTSVGGRVQSVFFLSFCVLAFVEGLEETLLPGLRVGIVRPGGVEEFSEGRPTCLEHAVCGATRAG